MIPEYMEEFENGNCRLRVDTHPGGLKTYWFQNGIAAMQLQEHELKDAIELLMSFYEERLKDEH